MMPELPIQFDLALARRLAEFSRRAYGVPDRKVGFATCPECGQDARFTGRLEACPTTVLFDPFTGAHVLVEDVGDAIVLAFRGTKDVRDWLTDIECIMTRLASTLAPPPEKSSPGRNTTCQYSPRQGGRNQIKVHEGFLMALDSLLPRIVEWLNGPEAGSTPKPLLITGHSLGGALASLAAFFLHQRGHQIRAVYTFASPRVGDANWRAAYRRQGAEAGFRRAGSPAPRQAGMSAATLGEKTFRLAAAGDLVPLVPGLLAGYRHVGQEVFLTKRCKDAIQGGAVAPPYHINPNHAWEILCDEWRAMRALGRLDLDFILQFHSIDKDYLPLLTCGNLPLGPNLGLAKARLRRRGGKQLVSGNLPPGANPGPANARFRRRAGKSGNPPPGPNLGLAKARIRRRGGKQLVSGNLPSGTNPGPANARLRRRAGKQLASTLAPPANTNGKRLASTLTPPASPANTHSSNAS